MRSKTHDAADLGFSKFARLAAAIAAMLLCFATPSAWPLSIKHIDRLHIDFSAGSSETSASSVRMLAQAIDKAQQRCGNKIEVIVLISAVNAKPGLAEAQIESVRRALIQLGAPEERIFSKSIDVKRHPGYSRQPELLPVNQVQFELVCTPTGLHPQ